MSDTLKAALWMSGAIFSFSSMAIAARSIALELDTFEIMMYRSLAGIAIVLSIGKLAGSLSQITCRHLGLHLVRNVAHFFGQNLWFYAVTIIPLAQVFALEFTSPLWVLIFSPFLLGEKLTNTRVFASLIGFAGILMIARPGAAPLSPGLLAAAASAIGFAFSIIFTKRLTRSETITCILFYLTVVQAGLGVVFAGYDGTITIPSLTSLPWLALISCAGLFAHFCLTTALKIAPATFVIPIDFIRLPLIALVGAILYGESIDTWFVCGALLIFGGNYFNILTQTRRKTPNC